MNQIQKRQRNSWTKQQDEALIYIKEELKVKKWTDIAKKLKQILNQHDRKDKHCRDRYENFLMQDEQRRKIWTTQNDIKLIQLYLQFGNKWSSMAQFFDGMNGVYIKNKFYSRMRKGIRTVNYLVDAYFLRNYKKLNTSIIFKLVTCAAEKFDFDPLSLIGQKIDRNINFIEEIVSKIFSLSFVDKLKIKKSPKQSKENSLNPQEIQKLVEQINFVDENAQKRRFNQIGTVSSILNKKEQNPKSPKVKIDYQPKIQQVSRQNEQNEQSCQNIHEKNHCNKFTRNLANKKIQVITNSFQNKYKSWIMDNLITENNASYLEQWNRNKTFLLGNEKIKQQSGYRKVIDSLNQTPLEFEQKQIDQKINFKQQIQDKQHNQ